MILKGSKSKTIKKFIINKPSTIILLVVALILIIAYIALAVYEANLNLLTELNIINKTLLIVLEPVLLILSLLASICFSAIISTGLIDINSKNTLFSEVMLKDICSSEEFYKLLSLDEQKKVLSILQTRVYSSSVKVEMLESVFDKLSQYSNNELFFEECAYEINCTIYDNHIEKTVIKRVTICSEIETSLKNFLLVGISYIGNSDDCFKPELIEVNVENNKVANSDLISEIVTDQTNQLSLKNGYTKTYEARISEDIKVSLLKPVSVYVKYVTKTPLSDKPYVCRLSHPCKNFSMQFNLNNTQERKKYKLYTAAFGFNDSASKSLNDNDNTSSVNIKFDGWVFPRDGVSISVLYDE